MEYKRQPPKDRIPTYNEWKHVPCEEEKNMGQFQEL
jgi:hypothetical protein